MSLQSIRIDATYLQQSAKKTVRVLGLLKSYEQSSKSCTLDSNGPITIRFSNDRGDLSSGNWYECIGIVQDDLSIKCIDFLNMGNNLNEKSVLKVVELSHKFPELFYDGEDAKVEA